MSSIIDLGLVAMATVNVWIYTGNLNAASAAFTALMLVILRKP